MLNSYEITWTNDEGDVVDVTTVEYGTTPTHEDPAKAANAEFTYTFAGWTPEVVTVTGDATYTATFTSTAKPEPETADPIIIEPETVSPKPVGPDKSYNIVPFLAIGGAALLAVAAAVVIIVLAAKRKKKK